MIVHLPFKKGGHNVLVSFEGSAEKSLNINKDLNWKNNYTKMYPAAANRIIEIKVLLPITKNEDGMSILKIKPLDPGIVLAKSNC